MITITTPEKAKHLHCEWLRARPREWYYTSSGTSTKVCTRASNIGTSKSTHTDDALLHTRFSSDIRYRGCV